MRAKTKKQKAVLIILLCMAVLLAAGAAGFYLLAARDTSDGDTADRNAANGNIADGDTAGKEVVMTVNGLDVTEEEYQFFEDQQAAAVSSYFATEYSADTGSRDFWDTVYGDETPAQRLKELTEEEIIRSKTVQSLSARYGLKYPETFTGLQEQREKENEQRAEDIAAGKTVYGPAEYGIYEYYSYVFGNLEEELKEKLREEVFTFTDDELIAAYQSIGEDYFDRGYLGEARVYVTEEPDGQEQSRVLSMFSELRDMLSSGGEADLEGLSEKYGTEVMMYEYFFDGESSFKDNAEMQQVMEVYGQLENGGVSELQNDMGYAYIVQCISKEDLGTSTWEENREFLTRYCLEEKYEDYIEELSEEAEVVRCE